MKVLITGDVNGSLNALFKRVSTVNKSNGPFDMLFCVGCFFPIAGKVHVTPEAITELCTDTCHRMLAGPGSDTSTVDSELQSCLSRSKQAPIPTYFIGSSGSGSSEAMQTLSNASTSNLHYLGRAGLKTLAGLNIAFLDGTFNQSAYQSNVPTASTSTGCAHYTQVTELQLRHLLGNIITCSADAPCCSDPNVGSLLNRVTTHQVPLTPV